jgi:Arm DNA-binding domain
MGRTTGRVRGTCASQWGHVLHCGLQSRLGARDAEEAATIGAVGKITPEQARSRAQGILGDVAHGRDPAKERRKAEAATGNTLRSVAENYLAREGRQLRTVGDRRATFERLVYPSLVQRFQSSNHIRRLDRVCKTRCGRPGPD